MAIIRNITSVSYWTMLSRVFGYLRDLAIAYFIGANYIFDAFIVAFRIPNMLRTIFGEGALSSSFVPIFANKLGNNGKDQASEFASNVLSLLLLVLIPLCIIAIIFMREIVTVFTPGFTDNIQAFELAVTFGRITFPYILFMSLMALYGGMLNSQEGFWVFASAPIILNVVQVTALLIAPEGELAGYALSWGALVAGILEMLWVMFFAYRVGLRLKVEKPRVDKDAIILLKRMGAGIIGSGVTQLNIFLSTVIASLVPAGISYLTYADRIYQLPLALIGTAIGTVLLPTLSREVAKNNSSQALQIQNTCLLVALFFILPSTIIILLFSQEIIVLLFAYGAFDKFAIEGVSSALAVFALALPAYVLNKVFVTNFFAYGDTKTPVKIAAFSLVLNAITSLLLIPMFKHVAVAVGAVVGAYSSMFLYMFMLRRYERIKFDGEFRREVIKIIMSAAVMLVVGLVAKITRGSGLITLVTGTLTGGFFFLVCAYVLNILEFRKLKFLTQIWIRKKK